MKMILTSGGAIIGGWIGWWLGDKVGFFTAWCVSCIGSAAGLYAGREIVRRFMDF